MDFRDVETPALILDEARLNANAERMLAHCRERDLFLRPHVKTAKCAEVAQIATGNRMSGITVSTLAEAEHFAKAGFSDILYAVGIVPGKFPRLSRISERTGQDITLILDSVEMARAVSLSGLENPVMIEIDCGEARGGLASDDGKLVEIAKLLGPLFRGIITHAGHSYATDELDRVKEIAGAEIGAARDAAGLLRDKGVEVQVVSVGSTPTVLHGEDFAGITEVRAGIYLFYDLSQYGRGICSLEDIALSVLATVIGHNRSAGVLTLDAGALAMSKDIGANTHLPGAGYGWLCDVRSMAPLGLSIDAVHQEHGTVMIDDPALFDRLPVGTQVRVLPGHACLTAAGGYGRYFTTEGELWTRIDGW